MEKLIKSKKLQIRIAKNFDAVAEKISLSHKSSWLSKQYLCMLKNTQNIDDNFQLITVEVEENNRLIAGEIGYIIGKTYTSLSGFSSREKPYQNYGTAQLVLLAKYLEEEGFAFWNLGQPYMSYKLALGAKIYERQDFLNRWFEASQ